MFKGARQFGAYITQEPQRPKEGPESATPTPDGRSLGGGFDLFLARHSDLLDKGTARHLETRLWGSDWLALFFDVLKCPKPRPYLSDENIDAWTEERKLNFQKAIPDYLLLARIYDPYSDVWYSPQEVLPLRGECLSVTARTKNESALQGLNTLIDACDKASQSDLGLLLVSD